MSSSSYSSPTQKFQELWSRLLTADDDQDDDVVVPLDQSDVEELNQLALEGADINQPFELLQMEETPLKFLLLFNPPKDKYDELLSFLFSYDIVPDPASIARANSPQLLEMFLRRTNDLKFFYTLKPSLVETLLGFPEVSLDEISPYNVSYLGGRDCIYSEYRDCLPIEKALIDYARDIGSAFTTVDDRKEVLRLLKKAESPPPRLVVVGEILDLISNEGTRQLFNEAYEYFKSI